MAVKELQIQYEEFLNLDDCPPVISELADLAMKAAKKAYAPYSKFQVGATIELADGSRYSASNQENKAYPSGLCAERSVLFYTQGLKPDVAVERIVLLAFDHGEMVNIPAFPCGGCRQVMVETEERGNVPMEVWMVGEQKIIKASSMDVLLPLKFSF